MVGWEMFIFLFIMFLNIRIIVKIEVLMRRCRILLYMLCLSSVLPAQQTLLLDGVWSFKPYASDSCFNVSESSLMTDWSPMIVPGSWNTENMYFSYVGKACYYTTFELPDNWNLPCSILRFNAVYESAEVYLNGFRLGRHKGGYTPFEFDVSRYLRKCNEIVVLVDNTYKRGAWWPWGGISRSVELFNMMPNRILYQHCTNMIDFDLGQIALNINYAICHGVDATFGLSYQLKDAAGDVIFQGDTVGIFVSCLGDTINLRQSFKIPIEKVRLWHFDSPVCYQLVSTLSTSGFPEHVVSDKIGFRRVEIKDAQLFLNGEAIRVNGLNRIHDHRAYGNTEPISLLRKDILNMKSVGGVMARIMHAPCAPELLDLCDELGLMLIPEIPVWGKADPNAVPDNPVTKQWLHEMIVRDYNHPCIIGWSVGNELAMNIQDWRMLSMTKEQQQYVCSMADYIRDNLDSTRMLTYASFTAFRDSSTVDNEPASFLDIVSVNCYGVADKQLEAVHQKWPNKALFVSEYGKEQIGESLDATLSDALVNTYDSIAALPYVVGTSLWSYNDYRSDYVGSNSSQSRSWGIVNEWRQKKQAFADLQKMYAPVAGVELFNNSDSIKIRIKPRPKGGLPNYILRGYYLTLDLFDWQGVVIACDTILLPTIEPGDDTIEFGRILRKKYKRCEVALHSSQHIVMYRTHIDYCLPSAPHVVNVESAGDGFRIFFDKHYNTDQYIVSYDSIESIVYSDYYYTSDSFGKGIGEISVVAINSLGKSRPVRISLKNDTSILLPPMLWAAEVVGTDVVIGYETRKADVGYSIVCESKSDKRIFDFPAVHAGSYRIKDLLPGQCYEIKISRNAHEKQSSWSRGINITIPCRQ